MEASRTVDGRFVGLSAVSGAAGGVMASWMMIYSAATGNGFWTPLNVCMASFIYRSEAQMMTHEMMMHPGMSMNEPVLASHLAVGFPVHMAFSIVVGVAFALVLFLATRVLRLSVLTARYGYVGASVIGALILYALMMHVILPPPIGANPVIPDMTPRRLHRRPRPVRADVRTGRFCPAATGPQSALGPAGRRLDRSTSRSCLSVGAPWGPSSVRKTRQLRPTASAPVPNGSRPSTRIVGEPRNPSRSAVSGESICSYSTVTSSVEMSRSTLRRRRSASVQCGHPSKYWTVMRTFQ